MVMGDDAKLVNELKELAMKTLDCKPYMPHVYHKKEGHFQPEFISMDLNARCDASVQVRSLVHFHRTPSVLQTPS